MSVALVAISTVVGCNARVAHNLPPSSQMMHPGPGVDGPGPGVLMPQAGMAPGMGMGATSQISFIGANGMEITWDVSRNGYLDSEPLITPGRQNFTQGGIYRLKLTNIPGRAGVELYPTLEVAPTTPRTDAYLAHAPVPIQFTEEDFDQVLNGNYVTKVIYLPDPEFQELAFSDVAEIVSTRLAPGVDPIEEAADRGSIMAILRVGNKDLELPGGMSSDQVIPAGYQDGYGGAPAGYGMPMGAPSAGFAPMATPPGAMSGINGPQWGMPHVGTPIGLPGPPHIPLGSPAGLTRHIVKNKTRVHLPNPVDTVRMTVKQRPGISYPQPVNRVRVTEAQRAPLRLFGGGGVSARPRGNGPPCPACNGAGCQMCR